MTVENNKGEKEILIDHQSFAAGYRQATLDLSRPQPSLLPFLISAALMLIIIYVFEGRKHE
jgi:hypothetical protein